MLKAAFSIVIACCFIVVQPVNAWQSDISGNVTEVGKTELSGDLAELPITISASQILVDDVFVNGEGPFRFLLDTGGMGGGRVDSALVEKLKLKQQGQVQAGDGTDRQTVELPVYELDSIRVGNLKWEEIRVLSRDYNSGGADQIRGPIDGILGFALFEPFLTTIDYGKHTIRVEKGSLPEPNGVDIMKLQHDGVPAVEISVAGQKHLARLDTGAMGGITVSEEIASSLDFSIEPAVVGQARTLTGSFEIKQAPLKGNVELGGVLLENPDLTIAVPMQGVNVGGQVLRDYVVTYDQHNRRVRLVPNPIKRPEAAPKRSRLGMGPISVPMKLHLGRPSIEAMVNGKGPFRFVLDTGAGGVTLDTEVVKQLELLPTGKTRVGDPATPDAVEVDTYQLELLTVGDATFESTEAIGLEGMSQFGYNGIIGTPVFQDALIALDYGNESLTFSRGAMPRDADATDFRLDAGYIITIPVRVGNETIDTHIDTGNPGMLNIPRSFASKLNWSVEPQLSGRARTISGEFDIYEGTLDGTIGFAGSTIENPTLQLNDRFDWGNLGSRSLQNKLLRIDQVNGKLCVTESDGDRKVDFGNDQSRPRYGMALGFGTDFVRVEQVFAGGLAEQEGLKAGDLIRSINGKSIDELDHTRMKELLRTQPLELVLEREGKKIELELGG